MMPDFGLNPDNEGDGAGGSTRELVEEAGALVERGGGGAGGMPGEVNK